MIVQQKIYIAKVCTYTNTHYSLCTQLFILNFHCNYSHLNTITASFFYLFTNLSISFVFFFLFMTSTSLRRFVYHSFEFIYNSIYFYSPTITILLFLVIFSKRIATFSCLSMIPADHFTRFFFVSSAKGAVCTCAWRRVFSECVTHHVVITLRPMWRT